MTKMAVPQQYCLRWKHHHTNVQSMFTQLLEKERFCDVTLYCSASFSTHMTDTECFESESMKGVSLRAHRVVLASCSELLGSLLGAHEAQGEPVLVIDGAEPKHVRALLHYMYTGEMNVHHSQLPGLLKTAEELRIKGLTDIRWNNKDEPPDEEGAITATATHIRKQPSEQGTPERKTTPEPKSIPAQNVTPEKKTTPESNTTPDKKSTPELKYTPDNKSTPEHKDGRTPSPDASVKSEIRSECDKDDRCSVNGGPPPLIKLPTKEKTSPLRVRRDLSDTESSSPKRRRLTSAAEHTDDDSRSQTKSEREQDWRHGNLDISAERVGPWYPQMSWSGSEDEWESAPADIASFLHTRLKVDGDNSNDDESTLEDAAAAPSRCSSLGSELPELKLELSNVTSLANKSGSSKDPFSVSKSSFDPRFPDVVKLNDYLLHGRRPQFWEENYVKRVMEAVRTKELEMKQAAEILGVSYGTLYGRYRDVYGCINRPYTHLPPEMRVGSSAKNSLVRTPRGSREVWIPKGPSEVLERLQRGEVNIEAASTALGVNPAQLAAYVSHVSEVAHSVPDMDPIAIETEGQPKKRQLQTVNILNNSLYLKSLRKISKKPVPQVSVSDDETSSNPGRGTPEQGNSGAAAAGGNCAWPSIRVANLDSLRPDLASPPTSPSALMRTRPDLTIVATKKPEDRT